jgi:transcriptional regulator with XRE-family HTH domain
MAVATVTLSQESFTSFKRPVSTGQRWILRHALGEEIYLLRIQAGYGKRHWLAREMGTSIPTLAALEKGRPTDRATVKLLQKLAQTFSLRLSITEPAPKTPAFYFPRPISN